MDHTSHLDTFVLDRMPPRDQQPVFLFERPELRYSERVNCVTELLDNAIAEGHGHRIAFHGPHESLTYSALQDRVNRIAAVLVHRLGLVPGNRVLLRGANSPMLAATWLATLKAGCIAVTTMPMLRSRELAPMVTKAHVQACLCEAELLPELAEATEGTPAAEKTRVYGSGELEALIAAESGDFPAVATARDDPCMLAFTSGTTGEPKATIHFHRDVLAIADVVGRRLLETSSEDLYIGSPPLGFTFGLGALLVFPLRFRAAAVLMGAAG